MGSLGRCAAHLLQGRPEGHEARFGNSEVRHPMALCFYLCAFAPIFHILVAYRPPKSEKSGQTRGAETLSSKQEQRGLRFLHGKPRLETGWLDYSKLQRQSRQRHRGCVLLASWIHRLPAHARQHSCRIRAEVAGGDELQLCLRTSVRVLADIPSEVLPTSLHVILVLQRIEEVQLLSHLRRLNTRLALPFRQRPHVLLNLRVIIWQWNFHRLEVYDWFRARAPWRPNTSRFLSRFRGSSGNFRLEVRLSEVVLGVGPVEDS